MGKTMRPRGRRRAAMLAGGAALALGGALFAAAPAFATGSHSAACAPFYNFNGLSTTTYASSSKADGTCGNVGASAHYRVSGGSLIYGTTVFGVIAATSNVPGGASGEGGGDIVTAAWPGFTSGFTT